MSEEAKTTKRPWWKPSIGVMIFLVLFGLWWGVPNFLKWRADAQVKELCAKDGGVKVYETVEITDEQFVWLSDSNNKNRITFKDYAAPEALYYYESETKNFNKLYLDVVRTEYRFIQKEPYKVLAINVFYSRRGGDPIGPWHHSSFSCPDPKKSVDMLNIVFEKKGK